ncbi:hypothetical protein QYF36_003046 [Acer negundo]|nr:hypothetical protein QYF36_003046 [Acer negundo]
MANMAFVWRFEAFGLVGGGLRCFEVSLSMPGLARDNVDVCSAAHCHVPFSTISFFVLAGLLQAWLGLVRDSVSVCPTAHCQAPFSTISFFVLAASTSVSWGITYSPFMYGVVDLD